ncbi:putative pH-response regulator protein palF/rim-8 [Podospora australis]|uniref:PH-response regulator protein palF/rim-8 n=1 Tax=Podospora australis TaxID=1536484 RepID=A0AAN6X3C7_9PEZI|nr:putative pH-response regulator protein palF/rim-8 [Podospora australis]
MGYSKSADNRAAASAPASASASTSVSVDDSTSASRRSFFSRFNLPIRSRARNITDFHIRPTEPHRKYGAGDHVQGAVILTVVKPVRITHLTVALHGYMRVYKGPNAPANEPIVNPAEIPSSAGRSARQKSQSGGRVNLFEDEQILSADGRLEPGRYEFNFDLLFPTKGLPSSIDFERGTISYMITATLTRPPSITTKVDQRTACERKIHLTEKVDIGTLHPPRSRTIYLEPISKRSKRKKQLSPSVEKAAVTHETPEPASDLDSTRANENSTEGSLSVVGEDHGQGHVGNHRSTIQSDMRSISGDSALTSSTSPSRNGDTSHPSAPGVLQAGKKASAVKDRTITATVELLRGGCLPGDWVPVKISIQHIRQLKSMHGVIVTLYRHGRIDSAPPAALSRELSKSETRRSEKDEIYPKSKTGLGGLSLTSAGSCSVFRKDLSQAFTPLFVNPDTLSATLTTSIRVPEDVFPTIKGVPYDMITFKYYIEVIVDLGGKLANQIQSNKIPGVRMSTAGGPMGPTGGSFDANAASLSSWGTSIIDTDPLRREKGVISVVYEVVVGTTDSSRVRGKSTLKITPAVQTIHVREDHHTQNGFVDETHSWPVSPEHDYPGASPYHQEYSPYPQSAPHTPYWDTIPVPPPPAPFYVPPPDVPDEGALSEKDRIRRAEQRLLPSQPPEPPAAGPSNSSDLLHGENIYSADDQAPDVEPPLQTPGVPNPQSMAEASAPTLDDLAGGAEVNHTEDKQERERRRLLAEASAPPDFPEDYDDNHHGAASSSATAAAPSAPTPLAAAAAAMYEPSAPALDDEDHYGPHYSYPAVVSGPSPLLLHHAPSAPPAEPLPRYER